MNFRNKLVFVLDKLFQRSLMLVNKAGAYPTVDEQKCTSLW
jgi:hypothetical protein